MNGKSQEEYEDDFEKDLDWLISEESKSEDQDGEYENIEAQIDKELEDDDDDDDDDDEEVSKTKHKGAQNAPKPANGPREQEEEEERWPTPLEPLEGGPEPDTEDDESSISGKLSSLLPPPPPLDVLPEAVPTGDAIDEDKKYILEKIQQANRELRDQEAPDLSRRRRLQFKDTLVDLVVPAVDYGGEGGGSSPNTGAVVGEQAGQAPPLDGDVEGEVSGKMQQLKISSSSLQENQATTATIRDSQRGKGVSGEATEEAAKEGRVLVEKDGKFDLVSLKEVESHGLLPPLACPVTTTNGGDNLALPISPGRKSSSALLFSSSQAAAAAAAAASCSSSSFSPRPNSGISPATLKIEHVAVYAPKPPPKPRNRPNSASHTLRRVSKEGVKRRVQSASSAPPLATFSLSPQQKEHLLRLQQKRERLAKEEEQRKREEEDQRRQDNELAFQGWLMRKRDQLHEEKRLVRAQEMERMHCKNEPCDPQEAFRVWLQRKEEQQVRERQLEDMRKMELESRFYLHDREQCEKAFKQWLRRKRAEKRAEQQAARERSRRLMLEERRSRRMQDILCTVNEAKAFRFADPYSYHF